MTKREAPRKPYYREFWFWVMMAPLIAVVFVVTALLTAALRGADNVVIDNYYTQGRLINQTFEQDERAAELGLVGNLSFSLESGDVQLDMATSEDVSLPGQLLLVMDHPAYSDLDQRLELRRVGASRYSGTLEQIPSNKRYLTLYPEMDLEQRRQAQWRLKGEVEFEPGPDVSVTLVPR